MPASGGRLTVPGVGMRVGAPWITAFDNGLARSAGVEGSGLRGLG